MQELRRNLPSWDVQSITLVEHVIAQNLACIGIAGQRAYRVTEDGSLLSYPCNYGPKGYGPELPIRCYRMPPPILCYRVSK